MQRTYLIPQEHIGDAEKVVGAYARRHNTDDAVRVSMAQGTPVMGEDGVYIPLTITLPDTLGGYLFVARIDHAKAAAGGYANKVNTLPGAQRAAPDEFTTAAPICHHCATKRLRNDTFLAWHPTDGWLQVGRQCLTDLTGVVNAEALLTFEATLDAKMEQIRQKPVKLGRTQVDMVQDQMLVDLRPYVAQVLACIRIQGRFLGRKDVSSRYDTTAAIATDPFYVQATTDQDRAQADQVIAWARGLDPRGDEFLADALPAFRGAQFDARDQGRVAAVVNSYLREQRRKEREAAPVSQAVGEPRQRLTLMLKVVKVKFSTEPGAYPGAAGRDRAWHLFEDERGNKLAWGTESLALSVGRRYVVRGTVRDHQPDRFGKPGSIITNLTRCTVEHTPDDPEAPIMEVWFALKEQEAAA